MQLISYKLLLLLGLTSLIWGCVNTQTNSETSTKVDTGAAHASPQSTQMQLESMTDYRDAEVYQVVKIGKQIWMAENLRYNAKDSWANTDYPSEVYGRLYDGITAQTVCPDGWHLPSDNEWNELEIALGMSILDAENTGWRGEHGTKMKAVSDWNRDGNGTNSSGFNVFPGGYFFDGDSTGGLGESMGYWASVEYPDSGAWIRFFAAPMKGVNRMYDDFSSNSRIACRCVKD